MENATSKKKKLAAAAFLLLAALLGAVLGSCVTKAFLQAGEVRAVTYRLPPEERAGKSGLAVAPAVVTKDPAVLEIKNLSDASAYVTVMAGERTVWTSDHALAPGEAARLKVKLGKGVEKMKVSTVQGEAEKGLGIQAAFEIPVKI